MPPRPEAVPVEKEEVEEEIARPWETMEIKDEEEAQREVREDLQLDPENKDFCEKFLQEEADEARRQFAREWFDSHRDELEDAGVPVREVSDEQKANLAIERGALKDLREKEEYQDQYEQIEDINSLRVDLQGRGLHLETPLLILNRLELAARALKVEIADMEAAGKSPEEIAIKQEELEQIFQARQELSQKVTGHDFQEEAGAQVDQEIESGRHANQEAYVTVRLGRRRDEVLGERTSAAFQTDWEKVPVAERTRAYHDNPREYANARLRYERQRLGANGIAINETTLLALISDGRRLADFRRTGIFTTTIHTGRESLSIADFQKLCFERNGAFQQNINETAQAQLEQEWEAWRNGIIHARADVRASRLAESPERAAEGVHGMFEKLRSQLLAEFTEKELRKDPKSAAELAEIKKKFGKEGPDAAQLMGDVLERRKGLDLLTGDLGRDSVYLRDFMADYGVKMTEAELKKRLGGRYNREMLKREKGFLDLLLELMFGPAQPEKKKKKKP